MWIWGLGPIYISILIPLLFFFFERINTDRQALPPLLPFPFPLLDFPEFYRAFAPPLECSFPGIPFSARILFFFSGKNVGPFSDVPADRFFRDSFVFLFAIDSVGQCSFAPPHRPPPRMLGVALFFDAVMLFFLLRKASVLNPPPNKRDALTRSSFA